MEGFLVAPRIALLTWHQSTEHDSSQVERKGRATSSLLQTLQTFLGTIQKKNSTTTCRGREKFSIMANRSLIRTPLAGSTWPGHKKRDCSFGRQGLTPLMFTIQWWPIASNKWYPREEIQLETRDSPRLDQPRR